MAAAICSALSMPVVLPSALILPLRASVFFKRFKMTGVAVSPNAFWILPMSLPVSVSPNFPLIWSRISTMGNMAPAAS
ncbi:hypothetical protein D3C78_1909090 [compost metagenome]